MSIHKVDDQKTRSVAQLNEARADLVARRSTAPQNQVDALTEQIWDIDRSIIAIIVVHIKELLSDPQVILALAKLNDLNAELAQSVAALKQAIETANDVAKIVSIAGRIAAAVAALA